MIREILRFILRGFAKVQDEVYAFLGYTVTLEVIR